MINLIRLLTRAAALVCALSVPAAAQAPAFDYDQLRDETAQRLSEYLRINTSNPPGNELATARWLKEVLAKEGIEGRSSTRPSWGRDGRISTPGSKGTVPARRSHWSTTWTWCRYPLSSGRSIRSPG